MKIALVRAGTSPQNIFDEEVSIGNTRWLSQSQQQERTQFNLTSLCQIGSTETTPIAREYQQRTPVMFSIPPGRYQKCRGATLIAAKNIRTRPA